MKKTLSLLMLLSIIGASYAQDKTKTEKTFDLSSDYPERRFTIELGHGNKLQIELKDMADLNRFTNMDSVLRIFLQDMEPFKDSLSNELTSKRIDYITDSSGKKKIRIQQFSQKGSTFLVDDGEVAALKL